MGAFCFGSATAQAHPPASEAQRNPVRISARRTAGTTDPYNFSDLLHSVLNCAIIKSEGGADVKKVLIVIAFIMAYAIFLSLGIECLLIVLSFIMSVSPDSGSAVSLYPRFFAFNVVVLICSLIALIGMFVFNFFISEKNGYTKRTWCIQTVISVVAALPMINLWKTLIMFLWKMF